MIVVLLGAPGAGKGTQCALLAEKLQIPHVSTGDLLREAVAAATPLGRLAQPYLERGELVPDATMIDLVRERLLQPDAARGAILDGFPRTIEQAAGLERMLDDLGRRIDHVIYLRVSVDVVVERTAARLLCAECGAAYHLRTSPPAVPGRCDQCGGALVPRPDDQPEVVRRRIEVYLEQTAPLIDFYRAHGVLAEVDGEQSVDDVQRSILAIVAPDLAGDG